MKKSLSWRLFVLVAGTLFALIAGMGLSAPAAASPAQVATAGSHYDYEDLNLKVNRDGKHVNLKVIGDDYDAKWVVVKVVQTNHHGKERVIDHRKVWTEKGDFKYQIKNVKCGNTYQAFSESKKDGWDKSDRIWIKCDRHGH